MDYTLDPVHLLLGAAALLVVLFFALNRFRRRPVQEAITEEPHEDVFAEIHRDPQPRSKP